MGESLLKVVRTLDESRRGRSAAAGEGEERGRFLIDVLRERFGGPIGWSNPVELASVLAEEEKPTSTVVSREEIDEIDMIERGRRVDVFERAASIAASRAELDSNPLSIGSDFVRLRYVSEIECRRVLADAAALNLTRSSASPPVFAPVLFSRPLVHSHHV